MGAAPNSGPAQAGVCLYIYLYFPVHIYMYSTYRYIYIHVYIFVYIYIYVDVCNCTNICILCVCAHLATFTSQGIACSYVQNRAEITTEMLEAPKLTTTSELVLSLQISRISRKDHIPTWAVQMPYKDYMAS